MKAIAILATALLSGCSAPLLAVAAVAIAVQHERSAGGTFGPPDTSAVGISRAEPELAPDRRINEVDCTKPIDWSLGNIRCK